MLTLNHIDYDNNAVSKGLILVVEDDVNLLEGVQSVLELEDYQVISVENGKEALQFLRATQRPPDLIVSDIMMPHMDGNQLLREVRKEPAWIKIPFIFLTACSEKTDIQHGKLLGVDDYLTKPFNAEELVIAVESRLNRQRALNDLHRGAIQDLKRTILTILNHEFRTPLTFVVAYADMLNDQRRDGFDDDTLLFLKGVSAGAVRLRRLIENFIHLVEVETGDAQRMYEVRRAPILDARELFDGALRAVANAMTIEHPISMDIDPALPMFVADSAYLQMALVQLVENAVKFSPADKPVTLGAYAANGEIHLWVRDGGRGIDLAQQENIWDTFYQIDREIYENQGTGSGLTIVQGIAEMHGGRASVQSQPGEGSIFTISFPIL